MWKRLVIRMAGEFEPARRDNVPRLAARDSLAARPTGTFHPLWGFALPSSGVLRIALVAVAVGVCAGVVAGQATFDTAVSNKLRARPTNQANSPISVQTEAVKSQSAESKTAAASITLNSTTSEQTKPMKPQSYSADLKPQYSSPASFDGNNPAKRAELQQLSINGQSSSDRQSCNIALCERYYRSFHASDCTYQPYGGRRQYCIR